VTENATAPTHCADCGRALLLRRPDRTRCEACHPGMRGIADILAARHAAELAREDGAD